jgi:phosphoribosylglycinamide formyltransferase-1
MNGNIVRVGVLASGRGSNFAALLRHQESGYFQSARIVALVSNVSTAGALEAARNAGMAADFISPKQFGSAAEYEQAIIDAMEQHQVEWLVLAGYMKIVGNTLLRRYPQRILNIHPSLLPSFPGLHAQQQALEHGVRVSGCTVHFVDSGMDTGPIIGQRAVPVLPDDTEDTLSSRILEQEHQLYAESLKRVTEEPWRIEGRRVIFG